MLLENLNIRYINLDSSINRRESIEQDFFNSNLIRITAIDGIEEFSSHDFDEYSRPEWNMDILKDLYKQKIVASDYRRYYDLTPTELGCNLSHTLAWRLFLQSNEEYSIFIEDDVKPIKDLLKIEIPSDCEMFYLVAEDHPGDRIQYFNDQQVKWSRTLMAYILSRKAAELCIKATKPFYYQTDWQIPFRLFKSFSPYYKKKNRFPNWTSLEKIKAYGTKESYIIHNKYAKITTFTKNGRKDWIPTNMLP